MHTSSTQFETTPIPVAKASADATTPTPAPSNIPVPSLSPSQSPFFTDSQTLILLKDFLSAEKPQGAGPNEVAMAMVLLAHRAMDHQVFHSHQAFANQLGCDEKTIRRTEAQLKKLGWISQSARKGRSKLTTLNLDALPTATPSLLKSPSQEALDLTGRYVEILEKSFNKKPHKRQINTQAWSAQRILIDCGGDTVMARTMLSHAFNNPKFKKAALKNLQTVWMRWKSIKQSYYLTTNRQAEMQTQSASIDNELVN
jgi:hypothetical protein